MRLPFVTVPRDDVVRGLRLNVADLQKRLDRTKKHLGFVSAANERRRQQLRIDRVYLDKVKRDAWLLVSLVQQRRSLPRDDVAEAADELRKALEGRS